MFIYRTIEHGLNESSDTTMFNLVQLSSVCIFKKEKHTGKKSEFKDP